MAGAHLGHVELGVGDLERSREFFTEVLGLFVTEETEDRVYLRAWQDWDHHTLILHRAAGPRVEHVGWRVESPEALQETERKLRDAGRQTIWVSGGQERGQGDGLRFWTPAGIPMEVYWEVDRFAPRDAGLESKLPSHPQRYPGRGAGPRRFDHVNFLVDDVVEEQTWLTGELGIHHRYYLQGPDGGRLGSWLSRTNISHEIAVMRNRSRGGTLLHHAAYFLDSPDQVMRAATLLADSGARIEWGPGNHGTSGAIFIYFFEPSGNRIEMWTGGFLIFAPDWEALRWDPETAPMGLELWGSAMPETYMTYGSPVLAAPSATTPDYKS
jgi:catechol 2,3-dioxygenase